MSDILYKNYHPNDLLKITSIEETLRTVYDGMYNVEEKVYEVEIDLNDLVKHLNIKLNSSYGRAGEVNNGKIRIPLFLIDPNCED